MRRLIAIIVIISFIFSNFQPVWAQSAEGFNVNQLPVPGAMVSPSQNFVPVLLKGLVIHPNQPFNFDFIVDSGNDSSDQTNIQEQSQRMIRYFLTALTIPSGDLWVNLSPYEKDRIITNELGQTDMGRDMLTQDYVLKQLTASLIYPEKDLGKEFWSRVYKKVEEKTGNTNVPVNTFNKVWIVPNGANVFEHGNAVYVTKASLKVMLEEDYLSLTKHNGITSVNKPQIDTTHSIGNQVVRDIILPEIEKEVNEGQNFALLRQVYYAAILAKWYRAEIQKTILGQVYLDKKKISGIDLADNTIKEQIYQRYIRAYKKGVFNFIKEDSDNLTGQIVPRKYFSGGEFLNQALISFRKVDKASVATVGKDFAISLKVVPEGADNAMIDGNNVLWENNATDRISNNVGLNAVRHKLQQMSILEFNQWLFSQGLKLVQISSKESLALPGEMVLENGTVEIMDARKNESYGNPFAAIHDGGLFEKNGRHFRIEKIDEKLEISKDVSPILHQVVLIQRDENELMLQFFRKGTNNFSAWRGKLASIGLRYEENLGSINGIVDVFYNGRIIRMNAYNLQGILSQKKQIIYKISGTPRESTDFISEIHNKLIGHFIMEDAVSMSPIEKSKYNLPESFEVTRTMSFRGVNFLIAGQPSRSPCVIVYEIENDGTLIQLTDKLPILDYNFKEDNYLHFSPDQRVLYVNTVELTEMDANGLGGRVIGAGICAVDLSQKEVLFNFNYYHNREMLKVSPNGNVVEFSHESLGGREMNWGPSQLRIFYSYHADTGILYASREYEDWKNFKVGDVDRLALELSKIFNNQAAFDRSYGSFDTRYFILPESFIRESWGIGSYRSGDWWVCKNKEHDGRPIIRNLPSEKYLFGLKNVYVGPVDTTIRKQQSQLIEGIIQLLQTIKEILVNDYGYEVANPAASAKVIKPDSAQITNGGIDLNQININRTGQRVNLQFDAAQMSEITRPNFSGFRIIVNSLTQIQNPLSLMGVSVLK